MKEKKVTETDKGRDENYMDKKPVQIEDCLGILLKNIKVIEETEDIRTEDCCGRVVSQDIKAPINVPSFPKAAMDGYAVFATDIKSVAIGRPKKLRVIGEVCAGDYEEFEYRKNSSIRVMTGAYVPKGYNAVVRQEDTDHGASDGWVKIYRDAVSYENYCQVGEDIPKGSIVVQKGTKLTPLHMGILASLGMNTVRVRRKAKVAIISTGNELLRLGEELIPGKIYGSISYMLAGAIKREDMDVVSMELCPDDEMQAVELLEKALKEADFIITTGALSVGKMDFLPGALEKMGAEVLFRGAEIQPGTPTMASKIGDKVILSLSGNPYAALANFEIYFWDAMAAMMGCDDLKPVIEEARLADEYDKINKKKRLIRAYTKDGKVSLPSQVHSSSVINNLSMCNCLIELEPEQKVRMGDNVKIRYIKGL